MLPLRKILCPTDFSEASYAAATAADELARHFEAEIILVHVVEPIPTAAGPLGQGSGFDVALYQKELTDAAERMLKETVMNRISRQVVVKVVVGEGEPAEEIARLAEELEADLITIATHGQTGWRHLVSGSVTEKLVRICRTPVLTALVRGKDS